MVDRIRALIQARELSPTQFADAIGVARPIISHILSGRNKASLEVVQKILTAFPDISMAWLLNGAGSMLAHPVQVASAGITAPTASDDALPTAEVPVAPATPRSVNAARAPRFTKAARPHTKLPEPPALPANPVGPAAPIPPQATEPVAVPSQTPGPSYTPDPAAPTKATTPPAPMQPALTPPAATNSSSAATAFAVPGKAIRRIVIFYQDGSFTDYQPEL